MAHSDITTPDDGHRLKETIRGVASTTPARSVVHFLTHDAPLPHKSRRWLYLKVAKKLRPPRTVVFDHPLPGSPTVRFALDGTIRELYWVGAFEVDSLPLFAAYARQSTGILDIGAAEGLYSLIAAALSTDATVVAFEPGSEQIQRLRRNVALNRPGPADHVQLVDVALSDHNGEQPFYELPGGTSSLNPDFRDSTVPRVVQVQKGDDLLPEVIGSHRIDLIKVDVESMEPEVLSGLEHTIRRDRPIIFCEVLRGRCEDRLQPLVDEHGYKTWWLGPDGPVHRDRIAGVPNYVNWLFLPDDRHPLDPCPIFSNQ